MSSSTIKNYIQQEVNQNYYSILLKLKKKLFPTIDNKKILIEASNLTTHNPSLQFLCFIIYKDGHNIIAKHQSSSKIQQLLKFGKQQKVDFVIQSIDFLAIFDKNQISMEQVMLKITENNKKITQQTVNQSIKRNLTIIPQYVNSSSVKKQLEQNRQQKDKSIPAKTNNNQSKNKNIPQTKQVKKSQLPRATGLRNQAKNEFKPSKNTVRQQKQVQKPERKLQLQSDNSDGQEKFEMGQFMKAFDSNKEKINEMELQNQGNYRQNNYNRPTVDKMQVQQPKPKENNKTAVQEEDSDEDMDGIFQQMNKKGAIKSKSIDIKSQHVKVQKNCHFSSKEPSKSVATKQSNLFAFMAKK